VNVYCNPQAVSQPREVARCVLCTGAEVMVGIFGNGPYFSQKNIDDEVVDLPDE